MAPVRTIDGVELPVTGRWAVDPAHADLAFIGRHFGLTKIRGHFKVVVGSVVIADDISLSRVVVEIDMTSVGSGDQTREDHLRSGDLFDVVAHPTSTLVSTELMVEADKGQLRGDLTIKGTTRQITLDIGYLGHATDPWSNERAVFSASATINREDWGITWNTVLDTGGLLVSKEIRLEIEVELIRQNP